MIKRFKTFLSEGLLKEGLTDIQKSGFTDYAKSKGVDISDNSTAVNFSRHVIPEGTDSIKIPAMNSIVQDIHDHLTNNGYHGIDYAREIAYKNTINNRGETQRQEVKIGKALNQTKAPKHLIDKFAGDDHKKSAELTSKYDIIISRNPMHIAGCSTNPDNPNIWSSCAKLGETGQPTGPASYHLHNDIKHGTHVAYLVPKDDTKTHDKLIDRAEGRILIKPFHPTNGVDRPILYPESRTYSNNEQVPSGFRETVKNFTDTHFPMADNVTYHKHPELYNDDGLTDAMKVNFNKPIDTSISGHNGISRMVKSQNIHPDDITKFLDSGHAIQNESVKHTILDALPHNRNFNASHIQQYIDNGHINDMYEPKDIYTHKHFSSKHLDYHIDKLLANNNTSGIRRVVIENGPNITSGHVDKIVNHISNNYNDDDTLPVIRSLANNTDKLSYDHVKSLIGTNNTNVHETLASSMWIDNKHKNKILTDLSKIDNSDVSTNLIQNNGLSTHHIDNILNHKTLSAENVLSIARLPISHEHINKILDYTVNNPEETGYNRTILNNLVNKQNLTVEHVNRLLSSDHFKEGTDIGDTASRRMLTNNKFSHEDLDKLLPTLSEYPLGVVIRNQKLAPRHIDHLLSGKPNLDIYNEIAASQNLTHEHIDKLLSHNDSELDANLVFKSNLAPRHIDHLINKHNGYLTGAVARNNTLTKEQHDRILDNKDKYVDKGGVAAMVAAAKNIHPETIDRLLNDSDIGNYGYMTLLHNSNINLKEHHFTKMLDNPNISSSALRQMSSHDNLSPNNIDHLINKYINGNSFVGKSAIINNLIRHHNTEDRQKELLKNHPDHDEWAY